MYRRQLRRRRRLAALALVGAALAVVVTVRASPVPVTPPAADAADAASCASLIARLPDTLDRQKGRAVTPPSMLTAAWGRPAITLRCGLPPVAHPVSAQQVCLGGAEGTCDGALDWFQDVFDTTLWVTRTAPRLAVRIPTDDGFADVLGPVTSAALAR